METKQISPGSGLAELSEPSAHEVQPIVLPTTVVLIERSRWRHLPHVTAVILVVALAVTGSLWQLFVCNIPLIRIVCTPSSNINSVRPASQQQFPLSSFSEFLTIQTSQFDTLLNDSIGISTISLEIKKAEMAMRDMTSLVRHSSIDGRDPLVKFLEEFTKDARGASQELLRFTSKVLRAVEGVLAAYEWAYRVVRMDIPQSSSLWTRIIPSLWNHHSDMAASRIFAQVLADLSTDLEKLVLDAQASLRDLEHLSGSLSVIHDMIVREGASATSTRSALLSEFWTRLGGNRDRLRHLDGTFMVLSSLAHFRMNATVHVENALFTLHWLVADVEGLRTDSALPNVLNKLPMDVQLDYLRIAIQRLWDGRSRALEKYRRTVSVESTFQFPFIDS